MKEKLINLFLAMIISVVVIILILIMWVLPAWQRLTTVDPDAKSILAFITVAPLFLVFILLGSVIGFFVLMILLYFVIGYLRKRKEK